jgi:organic hydroperoxide reductase OsmC/OhrA
MPHDKQHTYISRIEWTGNLGEGTSSYRAYSRDHVVSVAGRPDLLGSSDPAFRGDASRWNPEDLLVASLASCHMLWYLHLCAQARITLLAYHDNAVATMEEDAGGGGRFTQAVLRPAAIVAAGSDAVLAKSLHAEAHRLCFIANSVNFPISIEPTVIVTG